MLYQNVFTAVVLTFSLSLLLAVLAKGAAIVLRVPSESVADLVVISMLGGIVASALVGALAVVLALAANAYGWDLDSVAIPMITAIGDMVTIPALYLATFAAGIARVTPVTGIVLSAIAVYVTVMGLRSGSPMVRRTLPARACRSWR